MCSALARCMSLRDEDLLPPLASPEPHVGHAGPMPGGHSHERSLLSIYENLRRVCQAPLDHFIARGARQPRLARGDEAVRESPTDPCVKIVMKSLPRTIG